MMEFCFGIVFPTNMEDFLANPVNIYFGSISGDLIALAIDPAVVGDSTPRGLTPEITTAGESAR
jgi:hypothetical protein